jgi:hypothetical protein
MSDLSKMRLSCGPLLRRRARSLMDYHGVTWTEYKGLLFSEFIVRGEIDKLKLVAITLGRLANE